MEFPKQLKCAAVNDWPYYIFNDPMNPNNISGIEGELLKLLAERLKFQYTIVFPTDGHVFGFRDKYGNWSGVKGMVTRGEADMSVAHLGIYEDIFQAGQFSASYYAVRKTFATDLPRPLPKYTVLVRPFDAYVWLATVICFTLIPLIFHCLSLVAQRGYKNLSGDEKHRKNKVPSHAQGILDGFLFVSNTFLRFIYTSMILSVLTVERKEGVIRNSVELARVLASREYKGMLRVEVFSESLMKSNLKHLATIGTVVKSYHDVYVPREYQTKPFGEKRVVIDFNLMFDIMHGPTKYISDESLGDGQVAVFLRKDFCCLDRLNTVLLRILNGGFFEKFIRDVAFPIHARIQLLSTYSEGVAKLDLDSFSGIFFVLIMGYVFSLMLLGTEYVHNRCRSKTKKFK